MGISQTSATRLYGFEVMPCYAMPYLDVGLSVGTAVGLELGFEEGFKDGLDVGFEEGLTLALTVGLLVLGNKKSIISSAIR